MTWRMRGEMKDEESPAAFSLPKRGGRRATGNGGAALLERVDELRQAREPARRESRALNLGAH
jgi:hypothetical protein